MTLKRIFAACEHNLDKDVDWWVKYWDKECATQEKYIKECCKHAPVKPHPEFI